MLSPLPRAADAMRLCRVRVTPGEDAPVNMGCRAPTQAAVDHAAADETGRECAPGGSCVQLPTPATHPQQRRCNVLYMRSNVDDIPGARGLEL